MATIKSYTDISQSKKLAEILPLESADMRFCFSHTLSGRTIGHYPMIGREPSMGTVPCWSLATLLNILPKIINNETLFIETSAALWHIGYRNIYTARVDNPVDACYELILKLHELKIL